MSRMLSPLSRMLPRSAGIACALALIIMAQTGVTSRTATVIPIPPGPPAPNDTASYAATDSVSVLMFGSFNVTRVQLTAGSDWRLNGKAIPQRTLTIEATPGGLSVNGSSQAVCDARPEGARTIRIAANDREKSIRGRITITAQGGRLKLVAHMPVRDYLAAALTSEAMPNDPIEYLTALSVVQRNYLQFHRPRHLPDADMCDNTHCQMANLKEGWQRIYQAVDRAARLALTAEGGLPCYYSVACGGSTLTPAQIWNRSEAGYSNVTCTYCSKCPRYRWVRTIAATHDIGEVLRTAPPAPCIDDDLKIRLGRLAGFNNILSNTFERIERRGAVYVIAGRGFGHRIGLCQEGARELARHGWSADRILRYYFPAAQIRLTNGSSGPAAHGMH